MGHSVKELLGKMPDVAKALRCSLPVVMRSAEAREYPAVRGTCFAVGWAGRTIFASARHVVYPADAISIPVRFGAAPLECEFESLHVRTGFGDFENDDRLGLGLLVPSDPIDLDPAETQVFCLDVPGQAEKLSATPVSSVLAVVGYPMNDSRRAVDYDAGAVNVVMHHALGLYRGPSTVPGCHLLDIKTTEVGGPNGFSGAPVFRVLLEEQGVVPRLAGLVVRGNDDVMQFVDVAFLVDFLQKTFPSPHWSTPD